MTTNKMVSALRILPFEKVPAGDNTNARVELDGQYVGEIERELRTEWCGMARRYVVDAYTVRNEDGDLVGRFVVAEHGTPAGALSAAKAVAKTLRPVGA